MRIVLNKLIMRHTRQKEKLQTLLFEKPHHFKAEELYNLINKEGKVISLATIYRQLDGLVKEGKLKKINIDNTFFYDSRIEAHEHFYCIKCQSVSDVIIDDGLLAKSFNEHNDHELLSQEVIFRGICIDCLKKEKKRWN